MTAEVLKLRDDPKAAERNRCGILLATEATAGTTKTLSHVLWALCKRLDSICKLSVLPGYNFAVLLTLHQLTAFHCSQHARQPGLRKRCVSPRVLQAYVAPNASASA